LFEIFDKHLADLEGAMKLPKGITSRQLIPEIIARALEIPVELLATDVTGSKIAEFIGGALLAGLPGAVGPHLPGKWTERDTEDIYAIGKQWLLQATDPSSDDLVKIANAIQNLRLGFTFGDWNRIRLAFGAKSLPEISSDIARVTSAWAAAFGLPSFGAPSPGTPPPTPGGIPPLYRETLSGPTTAAAAPAPSTTPTGAPGRFRFTLDHGQPAVAPAAPRFRITLN